MAEPGAGPVLACTKGQRVGCAWADGGLLSSPSLYLAFPGVLQPQDRPPPQAIRWDVGLGMPPSWERGLAGLIWGCWSKMDAGEMLPGVAETPWGWR